MYFSETPCFRVRSLPVICSPPIIYEKHFAEEFAMTQVWRPLKGPVQSSPLGIIDTATVGSNDLINYRLHFPDRIGYNYGVQHNPGHRYVPYCSPVPESWLNLWISS